MQDPVEPCPDQKHEVGVLQRKRAPGCDRERVIVGNYGADLQGMIAEKAETVIYVNMPWSLMFWRIFWRSVARARDRQLICGDNVESWRQTFFSRDSLLWFLIKNRRGITRRRPARLRAWADGSQFIELGSRRALNCFYEARGLER